MAYRSVLLLVIGTVFWVFTDLVCSITGIHFPIEVTFSQRYLLSIASYMLMRLSQQSSMFNFSVVSLRWFWLLQLMPKIKKKKKNTRAEITNKNWMPYFIFSNYEVCKTWLCSSWLGLSHDQIGLLRFCENPFLLVSPLVSMTFLFVVLDTCQRRNYFHFLFLFYSHGKNIYISSSNACFLMKESSSPCI